MMIDATVRQALGQRELADLESAAIRFEKSLPADGIRAFEPFAYYDRALDCIRVAVKDCNACEFRINELLTVLHDTDPESEIAPIGFAIKGIRELYKQQGKSLDGVISLTEVLDDLVKKFPEETVLQVVSMLRKLSYKNRLEQVDLLEAA